MSSNGLPAGAFLTTINGRRCTAVPRVANLLTSTTTTSTESTTSTTTTTESETTTSTTSTTSETSTTTTSTTETSTTTSTTTSATPTTELVAAPVDDINRGDGLSLPGTTPPPPPATTAIAVIIPNPNKAAEELQSDVPPPPPPPPPPETTPETTPETIPETTSSVISSSVISEPEPQFSAAPILSQPQSSAPGFFVPSSPNSQADGNILASAVVPVISSNPAQAPSPNPPRVSATTPLFTAVDPTPTFLTVTDVPPVSRTESPVPNATTATSSDSSEAAVPVNDGAVRSTIAIAGGVIGGVVALSILAFFIWWWRRRILRKRRSTLLTPLDGVPPYDRDEKGGYVITRDSIGPTPVTEKVRAALGLKIKRIKGHIRNKTAPSVNLDRAPSPARSRSNSVGSEKGGGIKGWWNGLSSKRSNANNAADTRRPSQVSDERKAAIAAQPDFLTLLNMDDNQLDREAQRRRASLARLNGGSVGSTNDLLRNMNLALSASNGGNDNPFSDANAIPHLSAKPAPLAINNNAPANPFTDAAAIGVASGSPPAYDPTIRRSRTNSTDAAAAAAARGSRYTYRNTLRSSVGSLRSVTTAATSNYARNKFRSDPFDLERPELLGPSAAAGGVKNVIRPPTLATLASSTGATLGSEDLRISQVSSQPSVQQGRQSQQQQGGGQAQQGGGRDSRNGSDGRGRVESFTSRYSRYSAAESLGDMWSDPGPDVGPAAARRGSGASGESFGVGRAM
ncbi:hypothetical protein VTJ04DRAFT_10699 [Mycothermus thermophilus]|uniref:uncharacterized protein n=1 Tax=Humicola insolens TaxID=85995 RepID=UPI003742546A